jgi:hypothetical protein
MAKKRDVSISNGETLKSRQKEGKDGRADGPHSTMPIREAGGSAATSRAYLNGLRSCKRIMIAVYEKKCPGLKRGC